MCALSVAALASLSVLVLCLGACTLCVPHQASAEVTYGYRSVEVIGALINAVFLLSVCFIIALDALHRFA
jgi:Co/Zn/Cd efflux system component